MELLFRRIVYIFFIILFLIITPLVILYAQGYRYNFTKWRIQKTGILVISSLPKKADIYLNDQKFDGHATNAKIEYMLPGDYEIVLKKDGYHDWQKKLAIKENATTFAEKIILWKNDLPLALSSSTVYQWQPSSDGRQIAAVDDNNNNLLILDLDNDKIRNIGPIAEVDKVVSLVWSPSGKQILVLGNKGDDKIFIIISTESGQKQRLTDFNYTIVKWADDNTVLSRLINSDALYAVNAQGLWEVTANKNPKLILADDGLTDFYVTDRDIYLLKNRVLYLKNLSTGELKAVEVVGSESCQIEKVSKNRVVIWDKKNQDVFIIDPERKISTVAGKAKEIEWLDADTLLFYNDFEIYIYNFDKAEPELITRLGQPIKAALWHPQGRHLIFASDNTISVIELDNRELRNIVNLTEDTPLDFLTIDRKGKNLYFEGEAAGGKGIYKLAIQ